MGSRSPGAKPPSALLAEIEHAFADHDCVVAIAPLARREQRVDAAALAARLGARLAFVECTCSPGAARRHLWSRYASAAPAFLELRAARTLGQRRGYQPVADELGDAAVVRVDGARPADELKREVLGALGLDPDPAEPTAADEQTRPPSVVVVDDDADLRETLGELIEALGCPAVRFGGVAETLRWAAKAPDTPDLALLDYAMPGGIGLDLVGPLRQRWPGLVIVLLTAYDDPWLCDEAFRAGVSEYLRKPVRAADLLRLIENVRRARTVPAP